MRNIYLLAIGTLGLAFLTPLPLSASCSPFLSSLSAVQARSVHDYPHLMKRWKRVAISHHLTMRVMIQADGYPIYYLETRSPQPNRPWFYCSAGIHGDEPAGPEALIQWAESSKEIFKQLNVLIFPCLNPWGIVNNRRSNAQGVDLNRTYRDSNVPQTIAHKRIITGRKFDFALSLHEDYDGCGVYFYENIPFKPPFIIKQLMAASSHYIPPDPHPIIEGDRARGGLIQQNKRSRFGNLGTEGYYLYPSITRRCVIIETPSEFHINQRVALQVINLRLAAEYCRLLENKDKMSLSKR